MSVALVGAGGVLGALCRHLVGRRVEADTYDTLLVNVLGSFALGVVTTAPVPSTVALAFGTGFCGAFTTFSTFAFETVRLAETGRPRRAALNGCVNLAGALVAAVLGFLVGGAL